MKGPDLFHSARLAYRRPRREDAAGIFERYASDPDVTRYLSWPTHTTSADTDAFVSFSDAEWERWPAGPYLIESRTDGRLLGGTGFAFDAPWRAATGYVLARDAWGHGYATEALLAMVDLSCTLGVRRLFALCHPDHRASSRVLEKGGFEREGTLRGYATFPNLGPGLMDVLCYSRLFD